MHVVSRLLVFCCPLLFLVASSTVQVRAQSTQNTTILIPLAATIPTAPTTFLGDGKRFLCYEIYLSNLSSTAWTIQQLAVMNENEFPVLTVAGNDFDSVMFHPNVPRGSKGGTSAEIAPGESIIAFMWISLAKGTAIPTRLQHKLSVKRAGDDKTYEMNAPSTQVLSKLPAIASPLRGKNWVALNGPSNASLHRRTVLVIDGTPHISQRYAIDWVQIGDDNHTYQGDAKDNRNYHCFGVQALAIADGTVVEVKDGLPENVPNAPPVVPITMETVAGNHINLDLGGGVYVMYAHLQPGSLRVKLGDKVTRGQVIGLVGNTGNSSEPHLHFQLMNQNSPMDSEGLPYSLPAFTVTGSMVGDSDAGKMDRLASPRIQNDELPLEDEVVDFEP
jgi:hypothetical protein